MENNRDEKQGSPPNADFKELFSTANSFDYLMMFIGSISGIVTGLSLPYFNILFGQMLDGLNEDPNNFSDIIVFLTYQFIAVAGVNFVSGTLQIACWTIAGERQAQRLRERYVNSILRQDIGWFDTCGAGGLSTKVEDSSGLIQDGLGKKMGNLFEYTTAFVGSFGVAFYLSWELTVSDVVS
mmetsp:Transcript_36408/g.37087  ORF Transcript_36408/g.37087 Transcript_36408/m.37087 type:complete len:182 (-) Transcript_36408:8-553(-)